ncbi:hypothetical protein VDG1235_4472 [Verrucomicrobiia bacterium DG1235]|nr:hypothetical protein VDG1235_4472 [Verrucomicrobiae bacterium DG1235]
MNRLSRLSLLATATVALLLGGCAESPYDDVHAAPREIQAWENADISDYDKSQLLVHLNMLADESQKAAAAAAYVEFHHLEVALTPTLEALEIKAAGNEKALATIGVLKPLATKLHLAGHDGNVPMGTKLAASIADLSRRLATEMQ